MKLVRRCVAMAVFAAAILQTTLALAATVPAQSVLGVSFSDATHGYLAGGSSDLNGVLAYTADGGVTWKPSPNPNRRVWAIGAAIDGSSATAVGDYFDEAYLLSSAGVPSPMENPIFGGVMGFGGTETHINDVAYLSTGRVAVGQQVGTANNGNVAVLSHNAGGIWTPDFRPLYAPLSDGTPVLTYATLTSIDATAGGTVGWAVGTEYSLPQNAAIRTTLVYKTTDGGATWTSDIANGAIMVEPTSVSAADSNVVFMSYQAASLGSRKIWRRNAAGVWDNPQVAIGFQSSSLDAYDADHLVVVGDAGKVYYTANAQAATPTWAALTAGTNNLYGVQMTGPDSWVVVGGNETIVRFTNGGATQAGSYGLGNPIPAITSHVSGFSLPAGTISGTALDAGIGVSKVEVRIQRALDGKFWNGSTWIADSSQWNSASMPTNTTWTYPFASGETSALTITVRATDGMELKGQTAVNSSGQPIDITPPTTSSNAQPTYYPTPGQFITLTPSEPAATEYRFSGVGYYTSGTAVPVPTALGTYTVYFRSTDTVGNPESPDKSVTFSVVPVPAPPVSQSVTVRTWTRVAGKTSVKVRKSYTVSGTLSHAAAPGVVTVTITRKVGRKWKKYAAPRVRVSNGTYRYSFKPKYRGSYRIVSTYSGGTSGLTTYLSSRSSTKSMKVK